jgi:cytochrome c
MEMPKKLRAALALALGTSHAGIAAAQDAEAGERVFRQCQACHQIGEGAQNRVGPQLNGVIGTTAGTHAPDFNYSDAMKEAGAAGLVWDDQTLNEYLANPREKVPGTKMTFAGLRDEQQRLDVIAYLKEASVSE